MKTTTARIAKTTGLAATYRRIARWQAKGRTVAVLCLGQAFDLKAAAAAGANLARLLVSQPDNAAQVQEIYDALRRSRCVDRCFLIGCYRLGAAL